MNPVFNVTMDCVATLFTLVILIYLRLSSDRKDKLNILLSWMCVFTIGMLIGDIPNWVCEGFAKPWYPAALHSGVYIQYLSGCFAPWIYSLYLYTYLSRKSKMGKWLLPAIHSIFAINAMLLLLNCLKNTYYFIDSYNVYHRGELYWLSQAIPVVVLILDAIVVLYHQKFMRMQDVIAFLSYLVLPIAGIIVQLFFYGIPLTYLTCSLAVLIIFLCIQSEQRLLSEKQKNELDNAHLQVMLSQIQPHFLYNSLLGIKQLCDTSPPVASEALEHFSFYLRGNLDSLMSIKLVSFKQELAHIQDYLYLEKMRFSEELNIVWGISYDDFEIPPLTVQPLIENAIRHGINKKLGGGTLTIQSERTESTVIITIHDDGVGFDQRVPPNDNHSHIGVENTRKRLKTLCGGTLLIESQIGVGTTVKIILPN